jgi:PAS domain S-box-containing protein
MPQEDHLNIALLQAAVENSYDVITVMQEDGTILFGSPSFSQVLGFEVKDVLGTNAFDLVHPEDQPRLRQELAQALERGRGEVSTYRCRTRSGEWRWIKSTGALLAHSSHPTIVINSRDVTEHIQATEAQRKASRDILTIWESMTDAFFALDQQWDFSYINTQGERLLQRKQEELRGKNLWQEFPEAVDSVFYQQYQQAVREQVPVEFEAFYPPLNTWFEVHAYPSDVGLSVYFRNINERKQADFALRESEERFRRIFEEGPLGIAVVGPDNTVSHVNAQLCRMLGYTEEELKARTAADVTHPDDIGVNAHLTQQLFVGELSSYQVEKRYVTKDGQVMWGSLTGSLIRDERGQPLYALGIIEDISERKEAEEALRESEARLLNAQSIAHLGYLEMKAATGESCWSDETFRILGVEPHSFEPDVQQVLRRVHPEDLARATQAARELFEQGKPFDIEHRIVRPDGEVRWVQARAEVIESENGQPVRFASTLLDITQRKHAEEAQARLAAIVQSSHDAILSADSQAIITSWNPAAEGLYGFTAAEAIGQHLSFLLPPERMNEISEIREKLYRGEHIAAFETERRHKDGHLVPISLTVSFLIDSSGQVIGTSSVARDITERKQAEAALQQSQRLYHTLAHNFPNGGVYLLDREARVILAEGSGLADVGLSSKEIIGKHPREIFNDQDLYEKLQMGYQKAFEGEEPTFELGVRGRMRLVRMVPVRDKGDEITHVLIMTQDITEQKRAEEAQVRLVTIVESSSDAIISKTMEGVITTWNHGAEQVYGYTAEEAVGSHMSMLLPVDRPHEEDHLLHRLRRGEHVEHFETKRVHKDGHVVDVSISSSPLLHSNGEVIGASSIARDITAQKQAQAEQSRLAALLEATVDYVGWADTKGYVQYLNPAGRAMIGLSPNESVEGRSITELSPNWANDIIVKVGIPTASLQGSWSGETALLHQDGQEIPVSQVITAHKDANGQDLFYSTIARDISESKRVQAILKQAKEELEERVQERTAELATINHQLQGEVVERKMAAGALRQVVEMLEQARQESDAAKEEAEHANRSKSDFLSRMSHELRTPLNAIIGFGQILEMRDLEPKASRGVQQILKAGHHLLQLINEVLEISRIEAGRISLSIEPVEVLPLLQEVLNMLQPLAAQQHITLLNETTIGAAPNGGWFVRADRQRLQQVLLNLLSNAIKYNHEGGSVTISLQEGIERVGAGQEAADTSSLRIAVRDTGLGIAQEDQQKIFVPFERLGAESTKIEGTGIGLTLVKRLMELMHGQIGIDSQLGQGSTFWIELPVAESPSERLLRLHPQPASAVTSMLAINRQVTVLYIEDNASNLHLLEDVFEEMPQVRLLSAIQGRLGLELARQHRPDLVLLDLHLPDIQGDQVLQQLQADSATSHIPVVMLSADATPNQIERLLAAGARHYMTKPLDIKQLVQVLENLLEEQP